MMIYTLTAINLTNQKTAYKSNNGIINLNLTDGLWNYKF